MKKVILAIFAAIGLWTYFLKLHPHDFQQTVSCNAENLRGGRRIDDHLYQLTGTHLQVGQTSHSILELADPAPPYFALSGEIEIYGTGLYFIRYRNWQEFSVGGCYETHALDLRYPNGDPYLLSPWDIRKYMVFDSESLIRQFLIAGSMNTTRKGGHPTWPEDNATRSIYIYDKDNGRWVRRPTPLVWNAEPTWEGHSYGGNFHQLNQLRPSTLHAPKSNNTHIFYERSHIVRNGPYGTEIFGRVVHGANFQPSDVEVKVLSAGEPPYPSTLRQRGGFLIEGPRVMDVMLDGTLYFILVFSSGDFPTDSYGINYSWAKSPLGPYQPALKNDGSDLLDLSKHLKEKYNWSWVGRPAVYRTPEGHYEILFHAVEKRILPHINYKVWPKELGIFFRSIFKCRISISLDPDSKPKITLTPSTALLSQ